MNKSLIICDRLMYGALLAMIFFLPISFALIEASQLTMFVAGGLKCFLQKGRKHRLDRAPQSFSFSSSMGWSLIAIGVLIIVTIPFSHSPALSLKKFFSRFLQQILLMYSVTLVVHSRKRLYGVLVVLFSMFSVVFFDVMVQYIQGKSVIHHTALIYGRVTGPMDHPNDLGTFLVTVLPLVFMSIIAFRKRLALSMVISLLFLFLVIALGLSASRGAWVAFVVSLIALGVYLKRYKLTLFIVMMLAVFLWIFGIHCLNTRIDLYSHRLTEGTVLTPSLTNPFGLPPGYSALKIFFGLSGREFYWGTAVNVIKHYPWFGCGYNAYVQTLRYLHVGHEEYPHNIILHITAELGIIGLILYGWFYTSLCLQIKNVLRAIGRESDLFLLGAGLASGLLAWMIHSLTDTAWASLQLGVLWWLLIGILLSLTTVRSRS